MALDLGALRFRVIADTTEFNQQMNRVGETLTKVGQDLTMKVTAPIVGLGTAITKIGSDFDSAMAEVAAISGATGDDLAALREKAKEMGETTKFSASESAEALKYMAQAGWSTQEMMDGISGVMMAAAASGEDLGMVADIVTDSLTAFGLTAADSAHFVDVLAMASNASNTDIARMGATFKYVAPVAGALGFSIEDLSVAIGLMANQGIKGEQAGTSLRAVLTRLANPTKDAATAMADLGIAITDDAGNMRSFSDIVGDMRTGFSGLTESQKAAYAAMLGGQEAMSGLLSIVNATDEDFQSLTDSIANAEGTAQSMADVMLDNLGGDLTLLKSQLEGLAITVAEEMMPTLRDLAKRVSQVVDRLSKWTKENPQMVRTLLKVAAAAAAVGPALLGMGTAIKLCTTLGTVMASVFSPVSAIIAGVIAAIAALALAWEQNLGGIQNKTMEAFDIVTATIEAAMPRISQMFTQVWEFCQQVWREVGEPLFSTIGEIVKVCAKVFQTTFPVILRVVQAAFNGIKFVWDTILKPVFDFFIELVGKMLERVQEHLPAIGSLFDSCFKLVDTLWNEFVKPALEDFAGKVAWVWEKVSPILEWLQDKFDSVFGWIIEKVTEAIDAVNDFLDRFREAQEETGSGIHTSSSGRQHGGGGIQFASGGILTRATMFGMAGGRPLIGGEAGAEAVIPLAKLPEVMKSLGIQGGVTVNIQSPKALTAAEAARQFKRAQRSLALGVI